MGAPKCSSRSIVCAEAQTWFDRGLNWTFGYNHGEAIQCFLKALEAENAKLKKLLAESMLDVSTLREMLGKNF